VSVIISSRGQEAKLDACLRDLANQSHSPHEILVGLDGGTEADVDTARERYAPLFDRQLQVIEFERIGLMPIRADLLERARGDVFLSINDDVRFKSDFVAAHVRAQANAGSPRRPVLVTGPAPWAAVDEPTVFDEMVRRSSLIFFPQRPDDRGHVGYRECFGLNFSAPVGPTLRVGGFARFKHTYGYEDIEIAFRVCNAFDAPVHYADEAMVEHHHRYQPVDVMLREYCLGRSAWLFRQQNPEFTFDLFGRDIGKREELQFARATLRLGRSDAERIERSFVKLAQTRAMECPVPDALVETLAEHWLPLKRYLWRWGLLDQADERPFRFTPLSEAGPLP